MNDETKLWLWKNGDHFLAFESAYPCFTPGGDPMTLGEPAATAVFKVSHGRSSLTPSPAPSAAPHQGADALRKALADWDEVTENGCQDWPEAYAVIDAARTALAQHQAPQKGEQHE